MRFHRTAHVRVFAAGQRAPSARGVPSTLARETQTVCSIHHGWRQRTHQVLSIPERLSERAIAVSGSYFGRGRLRISIILIGLFVRRRLRAKVDAPHNLGLMKSTSTSSF